MCFETDNVKVDRTDRPVLVTFLGGVSDLLELYMTSIMYEFCQLNLLMQIHSTKWKLRLGKAARQQLFAQELLF